MIDWTLTVLKRYAQFSGRAGRPEYWWYTLAQLIFFIVMAVLALAIPALVFILYLVLLATFVPGIAVTVRRLHDVGRPGSYFFFNLIPFVGPIIMLVWLTTLSDGPNPYGQGPDPLLRRSPGLAAPHSMTSSHSSQPTPEAASIGFMAGSSAQDPGIGSFTRVSAGLECPKCLTHYMADQRFCTSCGTALPQACKQCNVLPVPGDQFCRTCGSSLSE